MIFPLFLDPNSKSDDRSLAGGQCSPILQTGFCFDFHACCCCTIMFCTIMNHLWFELICSALLWPFTVGSYSWCTVSWTGFCSRTPFIPFCNLNKAQGLHNLLGIDWCHQKFHLLVLTLKRPPRPTSLIPRQISFKGQDIPAHVRHNNFQTWMFGLKYYFPQLSYPVLFTNTVLVLEILDFYALLHCHLSIHLQFCVQKIKSYDSLRCLQWLSTPAIFFFSLPCNSCSFTFLLWFFGNSKVSPRVRLDRNTYGRTDWLTWVLPIG